MRSDHLAKHTKTHENKVKKLIAKKGEKLDKQAKSVISSSVPVIKQEKVEEEDIKPSVFPSEPNYMDVAKFGNTHDASPASSLPGQHAKPSIEDYYQSYHPYQYHQSNMYASNYFHQNSRFYQDKNYFYGHVVNDQSRGMFSSPPAGATAPQSSVATPTQEADVPLNGHQNEFYQQTSNFPASSNLHADQNLLYFNAPLNNTINSNTSNLMIHINNSTTNTSNNNNYHMHQQ